MNRPTAAIRFTIVAVGLVYSVLLYVSGVQLNTWVKHLIALLPALGTISLALWDGWLWKLPGINRLTHRPRLDGLWQVVIMPTSDSHIPDGGSRGPIPAYLVISQTYWSVHVRQYTAESVSRSRSFFWELPTSADTERLTFVYENDPQQRHQHRSARHLGACTLDIVGRLPQTISGVYFTDRYTKGDLEIRLIDRSGEHASYVKAKERAARTEEARASSA